jgi:sodium-dependent dicarboxylate transporter 2/3/5
MLASASLSMWISNTACTMLMLPIVLAMLKTLDDLEHNAERSRRLGPPLLLSIAYGSSLGGMTTLVGTPTNNAAVGAYAKLAGAVDLTFAQWLFCAGPLGGIYLWITWLILIRKLPYRDPADTELHSLLRARLQSLGTATLAERRMLLVFATTALLWTFRRPLEIQGRTVLPGWSEGYRWLFNTISSLLGGSSEALSLGGAQSISDTTVALAMAVLLFLIPSGMKSSPEEPLKSSALMDWETANKLPWDMILLFGGGFALADAFASTGLSGWMGESLRGPLSDQSSWVVIAALTGLMTFLTEFTSNVATVNTVMPTLLTLAEPLQIDPRVILITTTLASSCAFMLPIGTPPNAIVFATGRVPMRAMLGYGILLNLAGIPILTAGAFWIIKPVLGIP